MNDTANVKLENVSKRVGDFHLNHIDLVAKAGSIVGIIGENGAGKTTLLKILAKVISIDTGSISVPSKEEIGFVFDSNHFPEELSANELNDSMQYIFQNWNVSTFFHYIKRFELPEKLSIKNYSKGMKTKMGIAVALSHKPKILLLDEITSGLDPLIRDDVLTVIKDYVHNNVALAIMTTHLLDDVIKIADNVLVLDHGSIVLNENVSDVGNAQNLEGTLKQIIGRK